MCVKASNKCLHVCVFQSDGNGERESVRDLISLGDSLQRTAMTGGINNTSNTNWKK